VYSVTLRGDAKSARDSVVALPWISGIEASQQGEQTLWEVSVTDVDAAEDQLLSLLVSAGCKVADFGRKEYDLEDVFLDIVEGSGQ
jgi:ABC-type uncharacterized transport system ATPase subunit